MDRLESDDRVERRHYTIRGVTVRTDTVRGGAPAGYGFEKDGRAYSEGGFPCENCALKAARRKVAAVLRAAAVLALVVLTACGDDQGLVGDDVTADADPAAPDARADADPAAPDAGASDVAVLGDAGADADLIAPDATPACTSLPCYYDCDPYANTGCPFGGGCYLSPDDMSGPGYTWCADPGTKTQNQQCSSDDDCVPGHLCTAPNGLPPGSCHALCTSDHSGCDCTPNPAITYQGDVVSLCN